MNPEPKPHNEQDIEKLIDAQAQGESIQGVPTEEQAPNDAELDKRTSKVSPEEGPFYPEVGPAWDKIFTSHPPNE